MQCREMFMPGLIKDKSHIRIFAWEVQGNKSQELFSLTSSSDK